jgi:hypothetical protein
MDAYTTGCQPSGGEKMKLAASLLAVFALQAIGFPDRDQLFEDSQGAIDYLVDCLERDSAYEAGLLEHSSFSIEEEGTRDTEGGTRHYFDIAMLEIHTPEGPGDPSTAPVRDRFRVYASGRILYYSPVPGMYIPYKDFLEGRTDL